MKFFLAFFGIIAVAQCTVPELDGRIIGGQISDIRDFPYQVSVRIYDQHICGGTILDANTILTAAHCVYQLDHTKFSVRMGNTLHALGTQHIVAHVIQHPEYNDDNNNNDMAILKLASPISFSDSARPLQLQSPGVEVLVGTTAWVSGWGVTREGDKIPQMLLRAVDVSVITTSRCQENYNGLAIITSNMMCAQTIGQDSCQGDSGGPLVTDGRLIGVVSWGYGCARPEFPGVYAKVSEMYDWIVANI